MELEPRTGLIRKTFHGHGGAPHAAVAREHERLLMFHHALSGRPDVSCPRPIQLSLDGEPYVRMECADGLPMTRHLNDVEIGPDQRQAYGRAIAEGLLVYVETFDEPYWDLHFRNMFVAPNARRITLFDFDIPEPEALRRERLSHFTAVEISLGNLVGSTVFNAARPNQIRYGRLRRQSVLLAQQVVDVTMEQCRQRSLQLPTRDAVAQVARICFSLSADSGNRVRRCWYASSGRAMARRSAAGLRQPLRDIT